MKGLVTIVRVNTKKNDPSRRSTCEHMTAYVFLSEYDLRLLVVAIT